MSQCYVRYDLAFRYSVFCGQYSIAGAFGSLIAYGFLKIKGHLHGWQYLFIIEGAATALLGIFAYFYLPRHLSTAWFLNKEERAWARERMIRDSGGQDNSAAGITKRDVIEAFKDWKFWYILPGALCSNVISSTFQIFLPLITEGLGWSGITANLYAVPIYVIGAIGIWCFCYSSDHYKERSKHLFVALFFVFLGLILVNTLKSPKGRYAALCILQIGSSCGPVITIAWVVCNTPVPGKRALLLGFNGWTNLSGVIGSQLFQPKYAPDYKTPFHATIGIYSFVVVLYVSYRFVLVAVNKRRAKKVEAMTPEEIEEELTNEVRVGDKKLTYQYAL